MQILIAKILFELTTGDIADQDTDAIVTAAHWKLNKGNGRPGYGSSRLSNTFTPRSVALRPLSGLVPVTTRPEVIDFLPPAIRFVQCMRSSSSALTQ